MRGELARERDLKTCDKKDLREIRMQSQKYGVIESGRDHNNVFSCVNHPFLLHTDRGRRRLFQLQDIPECAENPPKTGFSLHLGCQGTAASKIVGYALILEVRLETHVRKTAN